MRAWFVSDIHLKNINERNSVILLRFLHSLQDDPKTTHLVFLGDIFDLWVGDSDVFQRKFQSIVDAIAELKRKGVEVLYFEGNHDVHVKDFWQGKFQIPVWVEHKVIQIGPHKVRLEHGDYINQEDQVYIKYLEFIRNPKMEKVAHAVPGRIWDMVGSWSSKKSRKRSSVKRRDSVEELRQKIRNYAIDKSKETDFDFIITGHMHVQDTYEFMHNGRKHVSINLGSWFEQAQALCLTDAGFEWWELK